MSNGERNLAAGKSWEENLFPEQTLRKVKSFDLKGGQPNLQDNQIVYMCSIELLQMVTWANEAVM